MEKEKEINGDSVRKMNKKKILLGAKYSVVEPLGLLHLAKVAGEEGYQAKIALADHPEFYEFDKIVKEYNPQVLGMTIYTGSHFQTFRYLDDLKKRNKDLLVVLGGPHATYFPKDSAKYSDYVVLSEGLNGLRKILRNEVPKGIVPLTKQEEFPIPHREEFYKSYPSYGNSPIKSIIGGSGCPYACNYCYNSSTLDNIVDSLDPKQAKEMGDVLGSAKRLFPITLRPVDNVLREVADIRHVSPSTKMFFFQDDVFGANIEWLKEFAAKYPKIGLPYHAQMRFEYADPKSPIGAERLDLLKQSGCNGLTFAIESADSTIRSEVLNRNMKEDLMFEVFDHVNWLGFRVRTEQMLGLPCGATSKPTKINLEADLETLELNVRLKEETGLPNMAWASIFAPYRGTKIAKYCQDHGFYTSWNDDVPDNFFERSVLRFPRQWTGPSLNAGDETLWLSRKELEDYRDKLKSLRDIFETCASVPKGHILAADFIKNGNGSLADYSTKRRRHVYDHVLYGIK